MSYFVTGATGFIGRNLVERLLTREGQIHVLVRPESIGRLDALIHRWGGAGRIRPVLGDLSRPLLGLDPEQVAELRGTIDHFVHLAAVYDMTADEAQDRLANVEGTRHAVALAGVLDAGCFHHASSIAVAGAYEGEFREDMFDEGQPLEHPYHRTKFEAEKLVRDETVVPWRVYRPAVVVGHSQSGEMDKIDGPYYFFKLIQRLGGAVPSWLPLVAPELGDTNIVPVDYVAAAIDHLAHQPGLDGRAFHLVNPRPQRSAEVVNAFARAAGAPRIAVQLDDELTLGLAGGARSLLMRLPGAHTVRRSVLAQVGIPDEVVDHIALVPRFATEETEHALDGSGIEVPELETYARTLWEYWERNLDPDEFRPDRSLANAVNGRTILITGASSGIGRAAALKLARAGGIPLLVARSADKLEEVRDEILAFGGSAHVYTADVSDPESIDQLVAQVLADHPAVDVLVNNAGRSIRRSVALSYDRFHDFERTIQLNYLGAVKLILALLPHMRARKRGHIVNVSSIGVQTSPPRFSAYVASKAALDAFTRVVGSETIADRVTFTTIHMPLVRTPMIAPTKLYNSFPTISPEEAADLICDAIRSKPKQINTRLGTFGEVAYALAPKAVDQLLHLAYRVFPDSAAAKGTTGGDERVSTEQLALAHLTRGVHW
ncbi:MAG TPA: SDR family oxidoreductase [Conexibacter sp.]|jgi:NAD(P)-dependent dehydrogenase (short-subunit alcohol dehydrogenase family)|nr:SDR family oxidoreductase [Conexibacter sp.]